MQVKSIKQGYFSPHGRCIAYTKELESGQRFNNDIFMLKFQEKEKIPLIEHPADEYILVWSPDGKYLLFASTRTGTTSVP